MSNSPGIRLMSNSVGIAIIYIMPDFYSSFAPYSQKIKIRISKLPARAQVKFPGISLVLRPNIKKQGPYGDFQFPYEEIMPGGKNNKTPAGIVPARAMIII